MSWKVVLRIGLNGLHFFVREITGVSSCVPIHSFRTVIAFTFSLPLQCRFPGFRILDSTVDRAHQLLHERPGSVAMRLEEAVELLPGDGGPDLLVMELATGGERTGAKDPRGPGRPGQQVAAGCARSGCGRPGR